MLLERELQLNILAQALVQTAAGAGRVVLVSGEAGIGKSSLVEAFARRRPADTRLLWGACEALFTPRPLGPLYDMAHQALPQLLAQLDAGDDNRALFASFLAELQHGPASSLVVIEDVHWADAATLDLIKFLGRRIQRTASLLLLTYRDDETGGQHPLRVVLGDLPAAASLRLRVPPLSPGAVAALAERAGLPAAGLHAATNGNAFFVTEVLAAGGQGLPGSVREAVLTRAGRLTPSARAVLDLVSVVPGACETWLVQAVLRADPSALVECCERGLLRQEHDTLTFRHELARQAIEDALPAARAVELHGLVLQALIDHDPAPAPLARLVHHAERASAGPAVLRYAPAAARQARALGAHREAVVHYRAALRYAVELPAAERADLLDGYAVECDLTDQMPEALSAQQAALDLWRDLGRRDREGRALLRLSEIAYKRYDRSEMERRAVEAIAIIETLPPGPELAMAYSHKARLHSVAEQYAETVLWGTCALELAERLGHVPTLTRALCDLGMQAIRHGSRAEGQVQLERSLNLALAHGLHAEAGRAYENLADGLLHARDYAASRHYLQAGIAYCAERDLDFWHVILLGSRARGWVEQGRWPAADQDIAAADAIWSEPIEEVLWPRLALQVRRGQHLAPELLASARQLGEVSPLFQYTCDFAALRAEAAWLAGDLARCQAEAAPLLPLAAERGAAREIGVLAYWLWRAGALARPPPQAAEPYATQILGDWTAAAMLWERQGCPYDQAIALMDGDQAAQRKALEILHQLGAAPAAALVRRKLRAAGERRVPRGPARATRHNPLGLTARQSEVLALLARGMRNAQIAAWLHLSPRTVDHHVAAILAKLNVASREAAAEVAIKHGLLS